ncbi:glycosyltransferase family 4 protein [Salipaludibacillus sp. CF4.18]|uniref:glycosyltransferase family 4 protein n=1 Tax=Salipaludibacillus sp. CF4.18 TaxID=3373081 RepID=UPI003EE7DC60
MNYPIHEYVIAFIISMGVALLITPYVIKISKKTGFVDLPSYRKVHMQAMPRIGGVSIIAGVAAGLVYLQPTSQYMMPFLIGAGIIIIVGLLDDRFNIKPLYKLAGQIVASIVVVSNGILIDSISLPFVGFIEFGLWSIPVTIIWILAITNAINIIDGLDGLAAGTSAISLAALLIVAVMDGQALAVALAIIFIGSTLGFLYYNFYPAKIFMGDTGSLFLGYSIAVISIFGLLKNLTMFTVIVPFVILGIPILDTLFAMIRRFVNKQGVMTADKLHFHYKLLELGLSHRNTVLVIYGINIVFGLTAIVFSSNVLWLSLLLGILVLIGVEIIAEVTELPGKKRNPFLHYCKKKFFKSRRS